MTFPNSNGGVVRHCSERLGVLVLCRTSSRVMSSLKTRMSTHKVQSVGQGAMRATEVAQTVLM